jgi:hypothetical protein
VVIALLLLLFVAGGSSMAATSYKVGDDCSGVKSGEYPKGLWCYRDNNGESTFQNIPVDLDDSEVNLLEYRIEQIICVEAKTRAECEIFGEKATKKILIKELGLTSSQANDILSCRNLREWAEEPPNSSCVSIYIEGPWAGGAPRVYYWHHYPEESAFAKFAALDGGAKVSIILLVLIALFFFALFYSGFRPTGSDRSSSQESIAIVKSLLSMAGVALGIIFVVWLYIGFIEPVFGGTKIDLSKKIFGVPQYMWPVIYGVYLTAWNSNRKK